MVLKTWLSCPRQFVKAAYLLAGVGSVWLLTTGSGCPPPTVTGLTPSTGPPRTIVEVNGSNLAFTVVKWDAGSAGETALATSLSGRMFSIPGSATVGSHQVASESSGGSSATSSFDVTAPVPFPAPRLDDVTVNLFSISSSGADFILMAHGANFDVGGTLVVDGVDQPTFFSRLLRANLARQPGTLGYPIYHYATIWCALADQTPGSSIQVQVRNLDGSSSDVFTYDIVATMQQLDSDGDGISDTVERTGDIDGDGTMDVDLPAMGANPLRKDVFVEVDWMNNAGAPPAPAVWTTVTDAFANLPVLNSDGSTGIAVWIDRGQGGAFTGGATAVPDRNCIRFGGGTTASVADLDAYKANATNFDSDRLRIFHYAIFAPDDGGCSTTCATGMNSRCSSGRTENFLANDFYVTCPWCADTDAVAGTFIHELGHNLNLFHGGDNAGQNWKPNYPSVMNYRYQFPGVSTDCDLTADGVFTYSQGMLATLDESNLNEPVGICDGIAQNWNGVAPSTEVGVSANTNAGDGDTDATDVHLDHADIPALRLNFTGAGSNWGGD